MAGAGLLSILTSNLQAVFIPFTHVICLGTPRSQHTQRSLSHPLAFFAVRLNLVTFKSLSLICCCRSFLLQSKFNLRFRNMNNLPKYAQKHKHNLYKRMGWAISVFFTLSSSPVFFSLKFIPLNFSFLVLLSLPSLKSVLCIPRVPHVCWRVPGLQNFTHVLSFAPASINQPCFCVAAAQAAYLPNCMGRTPFADNCASALRTLTWSETSIPLCLPLSPHISFFLCFLFLSIVSSFFSLVSFLS